MTNRSDRRTLVCCFRAGRSYNQQLIALISEKGPLFSVVIKNIPSAMFILARVVFQEISA